MILTVTTRYLEAIREGRKRSTIRAWPRCRVHVGQDVTFTNYRTSVQTRCTHVEPRQIGDLTESDAIADGFRSRTELIDALHAHYPHATASTSVWVIRFDVVGPRSVAAIAGDA